MQFITSVNNRIQPKAIFFDLDGTLLNSAPDLAAAVNLMLSHFELPHVSLTQVGRWIGNGAPKLVERALAHQSKSQSVTREALILPSQEQALAQFFAAYERVQGKHSVLYPRVLDTLNQLQQAKVKMAVITNKPKQFTPEVLKAHGLDTFFEFVLSGDSLPEKKPSAMPLLHALNHFKLDKSEVIMVGDSASDIGAANNAGVRSVCVTYGYNHGEDPRQLPANAHIDEFKLLAS
jgi:phosphoglycolate phosphatase